MTTEPFNTLDDLHQGLADELLEDAPPAPNDPRYAARTRWFNRGRADLATRWFLKSLLTYAPVAITDGVGTLPEDFTRPNALYAFGTVGGGQLYTDPYNTSGQLAITRDMTTGRYTVRLNSASTDVANAWYFATPAPLVEPTDPVLVDGEAVLFFAVTRSYFANRQYTPMAEARDEYENRVAEILKLNEIPAPGALLEMRSYGGATRLGTNERRFYSGTRRRGA